MKIFLGIIITAVAAAAIAGFFIIGSPGTVRLKKFDDIRIQHLQGIQSEILAYWQAKGRLPERLDDLNDLLRGFRSPADPLTGGSYEYEKKSDKTFVLCAKFALKSESTDNAFAPKYAPYPEYARGPFLGQSETWGHPSGRFCFERAIDPDFFKPTQLPNKNPID